MSSGSREIIHIAPETVIGTTPSPFARTSLPFTDSSLDAAVTKEDSATKLDTRLAQQGTITAVDYTGDINAEFRYGTYDDLIAANAYNAWVVDTPVAGSDTITFGGTTKKTFSILRGYTDVSNYHTFSGMFVNTFNITIPESGIVTTTFGMIGTNRIPSSVAPAGTVTTPTLTDPFSSVSVTDIQINGVTTAGVACITDFNFTWDNSAQTQRCLGDGLAIGNIIETLANGTGSFTMAWSAKGADMYESQFTNTTYKLSVKMVDGQGNKYLLTLPKIEITGNLPTGSNTDILSISYDYRTIEDAPTLTRTPV